MPALLSSKRCAECYRAIDSVFYDARIFACEGCRRMQVCESGHMRCRMFGRGKCERYELNAAGKFVKSSN